MHVHTNSCIHFIDCGVSVDKPPTVSSSVKCFSSTLLLHDDFVDTITIVYDVVALAIAQNSDIIFTI